MLVKIVSTSVGVTFLALTSLGAQAMQMSSTLSQAGAYGITKVAGGCGVGYDRGPLGGCVRVGAGVVVAPRPVVVAPRPVVVVAPRTVVRPRPVVIDRRPIVIR